MSIYGSTYDYLYGNVNNNNMNNNNNSLSTSTQSNNKIGKYASDIFGLGKIGYSLYNTLGSSSSGADLGTTGGGWLSLIGPVINSTKSALNGGSWNEDIPQAFFGVDDENGDSDTMQALKGAGSGAMTGAAIGSVVPGIGTAIGAIVGGLLGAGSSFLDDI